MRWPFPVVLEWISTMFTTYLHCVSFLELPTLLLPARDLVSLYLDYVLPTGCISLEVIVACLARLTKLTTDSNHVLS